MSESKPTVARVPRKPRPGGASAPDRVAWDVALAVLKVRVDQIEGFRRWLAGDSEGTGPRSLEAWQATWARYLAREVK